MPLTLEQYADYLDTQDFTWPAPPEVDRPKAKPHLVPLPGIRLVSWSVYGTLLRIAGGELYFEHPQKFIMEIALDKTLQEFKMWGSMTRKPGQPAELLGQMYRKALEEQRTLPSPGEKHPDIVSDQVWESIVKKLLHKDYQIDVGFYGSLNEFSRKVAYFFHASLQGVACYDGAADAMRHVASAGVPQGLLDNGQLFTPIQLARGLRRQDGAAVLGALVSPDLTVLSYQYRSRKPSPALFEIMAEAAADKGISPPEILHVGSRMALDVVPAKKVGMRTALFAGDKNSLEATPEQLKDAASRPDALLTELSQIRQIIVPG